MSRATLPEAEVTGRPVLAVADEDREAIAEILAELLLAALDREAKAIQEPGR